MITIDRHITPRRDFFSASSLNASGQMLGSLLQSVLKFQSGAQPFGTLVAQRASVGGSNKQWCGHVSPPTLKSSGPKPTRRGAARPASLRRPWPAPRRRGPLNQ